MESKTTTTMMNSQQEECSTSSDDKDHSRSTIIGVILGLLSAVLFSLVACIVHWGDQLGYPSMQLLLFRGFIQSSLSVLFAFTSIEYPVAESTDSTSISDDKITDAHAITTDHDVSSTDSDMDDMRMHTDQNHKVISNVNFICKYQMIKNDLLEISKKSWILLILRGITGGISTVFSMNSFTLLPVGDAVTLFSLYPMFTAFTAYFLLNEHITLMHFISLIFSVIGAVLISQPTFLFGDNNNNNNNNNNDISTHDTVYGSVYAILGAIFAATSVALVRKLKHLNNKLLVFSHGFAGMITGLILCFLLQYFNINGLFNNNIQFIPWLIMISVGIVGYGGQWTISWSLQLIPAGIASLLRASDILWSYIWQILFFNTIPDYLTIAGAFIVFLAIIIVCMEKLKSIKKLNDKKSSMKSSIIKLQGGIEIEIEMNTVDDQSENGNESNDSDNGIEIINGSINDELNSSVNAMSKKQLDYYDETKYEPLSPSITSDIN